MFKCYIYYIFEKVHKEGLGKIVRRHVCCKVGIVEIIGGVEVKVEVEVKYIE